MQRSRVLRVNVWHPVEFSEDAPCLKKVDSAVFRATPKKRVMRILAWLEKRSTSRLTHWASARMTATMADQVSLAASATFDRLVRDLDGSHLSPTNRPKNTKDELGEILMGFDGDETVCGNDRILFQCSDGELWLAVMLVNYVVPLEVEPGSRAAIGSD